MKKDINKVVEWLCVFCTRDELEQIAKEIGYKNVHRINRFKLEQIAYIDRVLCEPGATNYRIASKATGDALVKRCGRKYMVDYVLRECHFGYCDEMEAPIHKAYREELEITALD